jgi:hypothetical protein
MPDVTERPYSPSDQSKRAGRRAARTLAIAMAMLFAIACSGREDYWDGDAEIDPSCRDNPRDCEGLIGGRCQVDDDCDDGVCCRSDDCDRGMCLYLCDGNADCPGRQACDDGFCWFDCSADRDCAAGQECKSGRTVCKYD